MIVRRVDLDAIDEEKGCRCASSRLTATLSRCSTVDVDDMLLSREHQAPTTSSSWRESFVTHYHRAEA